MAESYFIFAKNAKAGVRSANELIETYLKSKNRIVSNSTSVISLLVKSDKFDRILVTSNNFLYLYLFLLIGKIQAKQLIYILHGYRRFDLLAIVSYGTLMIASRHRGIKFISNSELTRSFYHRFCGISSSVLHFSRIRPPSPERPEIGALKEANTLNIVLAGSDASHKNVGWTLDALMRGWSPPNRFVVRVQCFARLEYKDTRVVTHGFVNRATFLNHLRHADIFISMCELEPYGLAIEEALQAGCFVICHKYSGVLEANSINIKGVPKTKYAVRQAVEAFLARYE